MIIAEKLREENIAEYIIHLYKTEELIRAFECDVALIAKHVIVNMEMSDKEAEKTIAWYANIHEQMVREGVEKRGHIGSVNVIVNELSEMSKRLLKTDPQYIHFYVQAEPYIEENIRFAAGKITDPIQICLNGIFGLLLLKMEGKKVPENMEAGLKAFGAVLAYLSYQYKLKKKIENN